VKLIKLKVYNHKALNNFELDFTNTSSNINYIIGNNGSGKSTIFEVILEIFKAIILQEKIGFSFELTYKINNKEVFISGENSKKIVLSDNFSFESDLPHSIVIYYSGISRKIDDICLAIEDDFVATIKKSYFKPRVLFNVKDRHFYYILAALLSQEPFEWLAVNSEDNPVGLLGVLRDKTNIESLSLLSLVIEKKSNLLGVTKEFLEKLESCANDIIVLKGKQIKLNFDNNALRSFRSEVGLDRDVLKALDILYFAGIIVDIDISLNMEYGDINNPIKQVINANELSEGEKQTCIILGVSEFFGYKETLYLFDEPDSYLHPSWQLDFNSRLVELSTKQYFLVTTHSPTLISRVKKENVFLIDKGQIIQTPHTFGRDFTEILEDVMGVTEKNPITSPLFDKFYELVDNEEYLGAEKILKELTNYMGTEDKQIFRARSILEYERG
jgi:ABC-type multidrug transport system ATPase subunit